MFVGATFLSGNQVGIGWWQYLIDTDNDNDIAYKNIIGRDPFNQNFRKFQSKTQWIGLVQPEKFRKKGSTFWGGPLFPVGPVGILVEWIAPSVSPNGISCKFMTLGWPVPILKAYMNGDSFWENGWIRQFQRSREGFRIREIADKTFSRLPSTWNFV